MKLELKYIAPYLPYGLKSVDFSAMQYGITKPLIGDIDPSNVMKFFDNSTRAKPILRPLSDFEADDLIKVKEYLGLGKWCDYYDEYFDAWFNDGCSVDSLIIQAPYEIMQYFLENHFDAFGLIPQGLAVDINTLK